MAIDARHPDYDKYHDQWKRIDDIINLSNLCDHLIPLNKNDTSAENKERNAAYRKRAVFYALTAQTLAGMVGIVFAKDPAFDPSDLYSYMKDDVDGNGNSIYQQAQSVVRSVTAKSRNGLFVTFPDTEGKILSMADMQTGNYVANIHSVPANNITNWKTERVGSKNVLTLVVIKEEEQEYVDYEVKNVEIRRELFLENGVYGERKWKKNEDGDWIAEAPKFPTDNKGNTWDEIPFTFVGSQNNDVNVDSPAMLGMVDVNIAHYRNSADYEDSVWYVGQAQPWMSGVEQDHIDLMTKNNMYVGSRNLIAVPSGEQFGFASAPPNPMVRQAMMDKVDMMVGLGARMITAGGVAKTADQSNNEKRIQHSPLSLVAKNVSEAYTKCLGWAERYMGTEEEMEFELDDDFINAESTPAELKEVIAGFISGAVPNRDYIEYMKNYGIFNEEKPTDDYMEEMLNLGGGGE